MRRAVHVKRERFHFPTRGKAKNGSRQVIETYLTSTSTPEVHTSTESHSQYVRVAPVHQVQVEVILELRRVQHFVGHSWDLPQRLLRRRQQLLTFPAEVIVTIDSMPGFILSMISIKHSNLVQTRRLLMLNVTN